MSGPCALLAAPGSRARNLARVIRSVGLVAEPHTDSDPFLDTCRAAHIVVVDLGEPLDPDRFRVAFELAARGLQRHTVLIGNLQAPDQFLELLGADLLHHVIPASSPRLLERLAITLARLREGHAVGIERYLPWGTQIHGFVVRRSSAKDELLERLTAFAEAMEIPDRLATLARTVSDEFLMNALYDAPVDGAGRPIFAEVARQETIEMPADRPARFRFAATGSELVVSVQDAFGSLTGPTVRANLQRTMTGGDDQIRTRGAGAGMGLFMAFSALSEWIVEISPGRTTEMIGIIETGGSYRDHVATPKGFHLFEGVASTAG